MKTLKFNNKKVLDLLKENETISKEINKMVEVWQKQDEIAKKLQMKMERIKEKIRPIVAEEVKKANILEEFDIVQSTKYKGNDIIVDIVNRIDLIKKQLRDEQTKNNLGENKANTGATETKGEKGKD
jgi:hypothetical protein